MARAPSTQTGARPGAETFIERREAMLKRILELLTEKPMALADIEWATGLPKATTNTYVMRLVERGQVECAGKRNGRQMIWSACGKQAPQEDERAANTVRAEQIGMHRDPLVAALFGPAK